MCCSGVIVTTQMGQVLLKFCRSLLEHPSSVHITMLS